MEPHKSKMKTATLPNTSPTWRRVDPEFYHLHGKNKNKRWCHTICIPRSAMCKGCSWWLLGGENKDNNRKDIDTVLLYPHVQTKKPTTSKSIYIQRSVARLMYTRRLRAERTAYLHRKPQEPDTAGVARLTKTTKKHPQPSTLSTKPTTNGSGTLYVHKSNPLRAAL